MEEGREGEGGCCCRAVSVYSLHTMTNLCTDELECDKNAGLGRAAREGGEEGEDKTDSF